MLIEICHGSVLFGAETILSDINFIVKNTEKIAIIGRNGCSKTTLLNLISGRIDLDRNDSEQDIFISRWGGLSVGYLQQNTFGQSYGARQAEELKSYFRAGLLINFVGSLIINILLLFGGRGICALFGTDTETLEFAVKAMPLFAWGFVVMSLNVMISAYLYSTKRSKQAIIINILRSLVVDSAVILLFPAIFGRGVIWFTFGIYEALVLVVSVFLLKQSEKNGIVYQ